MKILLRGIRRVHAQQCSSPRIRLATHHSLNHEAHKDPTRWRPLSLSQQAHLGGLLYRLFWFRLIWAACCTGFFGFLRCGEFLVPDGTPFHPSFHLCLSDLTLDQSSPQWRITLHIKVSKTDQFRRGTTIVLGATAADLCPVSALLDYLAARGGAPGPLFITGNSQAIPRHSPALYLFNRYRPPCRPLALMGPNLMGTASALEQQPLPAKLACQKPQLRSLVAGKVRLINNISVHWLTTWLMYLVNSVDYGIFYFLFFFSSCFVSRCLFLFLFVCLSLISLSNYCHIFE